MSAVQVNLRVPPELLEAIDGARGTTKRNPFLVTAIARSLAEYEPPEAVETRPSSVRAPKGCRVVGVPAEARAL